MQRNYYADDNVYVDGVLIYEFDDVARMFIDRTVDPPVSRPYTAAENAELDAVLAARADEATRRTIEEALGTALVTMQTILDTPKSTINADPAGYIKDIARANRRMIRLLTRRFDATS